MAGVGFFSVIIVFASLPFFHQAKSHKSRAIFFRKNWPPSSAPGKRPHFPAARGQCFCLCKSQPKLGDDIDLPPCEFLSRPRKYASQHRGMPKIFSTRPPPSIPSRGPAVKRLSPPIAILFAPENNSPRRSTWASVAPASS